MTGSITWLINLSPPFLLFSWEQFFSTWNFICYVLICHVGNVKNHVTEHDPRKRNFKKGNFKKFQNSKIQNFKISNFVTFTLLVPPYISTIWHYGRIIHFGDSAIQHYSGVWYNILHRRNIPAAFSCIAVSVNVSFYRMLFKASLNVIG